MHLIVRPETVEDHDAIRKINELATGRKNNGDQIERLRRGKHFIPELSLVAESDNRIVGHILFYLVQIRGDRETHMSLALAPMAVHPECQRRGVGVRLVQEGLSVAKELGYDSVIVVGHPEYYSMFGFSPANSWNIKAPFDVPDDTFLALELIDGALQDVSGTVEYPEAFDEV
jgi:putative acetyltransferase